MLVFVAGCNRSCEGCQNPELKSFTNGVEFTPNELLLKFEKMSMCDSVCFTGGDPIYQPTLLEYIDIFKSHSVKVGMYTGEAFENINSNLLGSLNFIKSDEYVASRGGVEDVNTNQRCWIKKEGKFVQKTWSELNDKNV
jgi:organic radical activating enzyme